MSEHLKEIIRDAKLDGIELLSFSSERQNEGQVGGLLRKPNKVRISLELNLGVPSAPPDDRISYLVSADVRWHEAIDIEEQMIAQIKLAFRVSYSFAGEKLGPDEVEIFGNKVAVHNAWAFLREKIHTGSIWLGLHPFVLPLKPIADDLSESKPPVLVDSSTR